MGLANGKPFKLREDRFDVDGTTLSKLLGTTVLDLKRKLRHRDSDLQKLETATTSVADLLDSVTVGEGIMFPVEMLPSILSGGQRFRDVMPARVRALCTSFFQNGVQQHTGSSLHACIFLPEQMDEDDTDPVSAGRFT